MGEKRGSDLVPDVQFSSVLTWIYTRTSSSVHFRVLSPAKLSSLTVAKELGTSLKSWKLCRSTHVGLDLLSLYQVCNAHLLKQHHLLKYIYMCAVK